MTADGFPQLIREVLEAAGVEHEAAGIQVSETIVRLNQAIAQEIMERVGIEKQAELLQKLENAGTYEELEQILHLACESAGIAWEEVEEKVFISSSDRIFRPLFASMTAEQTEKARGVMTVWMGGQNGR